MKGLFFCDSFELIDLTAPTNPSENEFPCSVIICEDGRWIFFSNLAFQNMIFFQEIEKLKHELERSQEEKYCVRQMSAE